MHQKSIKSLTVTISLLPISNLALMAENKKVGMPEKPNIILILCDDLGYSQLGCYGSEIETPNLDSLANYGVRFTQFHNTAKSFPSRACLLTGLYAQQCGMSENPAAIVNSISLGDMLRTAGYTTLFSGKNHSTTPLYGFGFDRTCEFLGGSTNHLNPGPQRAGEPYPIDKGRVGNYSTFNFDNVTNKAFITPAGYYSTNFYTDEAIKFINNTPTQNPFFLYLAYQAPHDPLQALEQDIAKYRGKYLAGYTGIREARWQNMKELGVVDPSMTLSAQNTANWSSLSLDEKVKEDARMAVMSAMVDCIDQNVGKLIQVLKQRGQLENTLIMFASDNGACTEGNENNTFNVPNIGAIGSINYYAYPGDSWPNVCNTPYRYFKNDSYEGGICTPFIAFWPAGMPNKGIINNNTYHFIDVMPTLKEISGGTYPTSFRGQNIVPMQGRSFLPVLQNGMDSARLKPVFWQWANGTAVRVGDWKAVSLKGTWALFNMSLDRNETKDLKTTNAIKFNELKALYDNWIATVGNKTALNTTSKYALKLFPNPSKNTIHWSHIDDLDEVVVTNLNGVIVHKIKNQITDFIDLNNLANGMYIISLYQNNQQISTQKIVKE